MSTDGIFYASMVISQGMPLSRPEISAKGFIDNDNTKIHNLLQKDIEEKLHRALREGKSDIEIEDSLKKGIKNYIFKLTKRTPIIVIKVIEV
jgi:mRNA degradation ribonuclease J1/J2